MFVSVQLTCYTLRPFIKPDMEFLHAIYRC